MYRVKVQPVFPPLTRKNRRKRHQIVQRKREKPVKAKLRRKNMLMRVGRLDVADALARQISKDISKSTKSRLSHISLRRGTKGVWAAVRELMS